MTSTSAIRASLVVILISVCIGPPTIQRPTPLRRVAPAITALAATLLLYDGICLYDSLEACGRPCTTLRVPQDILARLDELRGDDTRSAWVLRLIDRELTGQRACPQIREALTDPGPLALPAGEPCPGTVCSGPGCWNRDTARYGLRHLVLCTACAAALQGHAYKREVPEAAARALRRGAA